MHTLNPHGVSKSTIQGDASSTAVAVRDADHGPPRPSPRCQYSGVPASGTRPARAAAASTAREWVAPGGVFALWAGSCAASSSSVSNSGTKLDKPLGPRVEQDQNH